MQNYFCKTKNRSILGSSGRVRLGLSSTTAGSSQTRWPIRILEKTAAIPAPRRFSQGTGTNVAAAHPVAQLISRISLPTFRCNTRTTHASPRTHTFHTTYDALGRRVSRNLGYGKESTKFTYDGDDVLVDDNFGTLTKYVNGAGIDNKLRTQTGSNVSYFLVDHLGSTNGLTNSTGSLTASNSYDSFGNPTNAGFSSRYQFTGREFDSFSGLQYSRARFYDPNLGRFVSEDPIGFGGGDVNLFGYVRNNPQNWRDPLGLCPFCYWGDNPYDIIPEAGWTAIAYTGNFAAGFGDNITTIPFTDISLTEEARKSLGSNDVVDKCSGIYSAGGWTGFGAQVAMGGAGGLKAAGTRGAGKEFSHWIPNRLGGPRSRTNGNFVEIAEHALSDPHRYRFMPRSWKSNNPLPNPVVQHWNRIPKVYKGGAAGAAVASTRLNPLHRLD